MTITDMIKEIVKNDEEIYSVVGTVKSVNTSKRTCIVEPNNGDAALLNVRLQADMSIKNGFLIVPKTGSHVVITFLSQETAYVAMCSEIEKVLIVVKDKRVEINEKGLKVASQTSNLKSEINSICAVISSVYDLLIDPTTFMTGAGLPVIINPAALPKVTQAKLKIEQIKQGINTFLTE